MSITIDTLLDGTILGDPQSVGYLSITPVLDESGNASNDTFGPPNVHMGTSNYGEVNLRNNDSERPTIVPTGSSWIVDERAQDHAIPGAKILKSKELATIDTARCIEPSQAGTISMGERAFSILPMQLRRNAILSRNVKGYNKLWDSIQNFNKGTGVNNEALSAFEKKYAKELDEFVAEFELIPKQIGAIIYLNDNVIGIERAPNIEFWKKIWVPLIRMCYGSVAIYARHKALPPPNFREGLRLRRKTLAGIRDALFAANVTVQNVLLKLYDMIRTKEISSATEPDDRYENYRLLTIGSSNYTGQMVVDASIKKIPYISICGA